MSETTPVEPGELIEVAKGLRALGAATFTYKGCEVAFFPPEFAPPAQVVAEVDEKEPAEDRKARLERLRREAAQADLYASA